VAAPIELPGTIIILSHEIAIRAPAEMARLLINAIVRRSVPIIASLICVAASTLPPKVLILKIIASAFASSASETTRET